LDVKSILNLSLCAKKYFLVVNPILTVLSLDYAKGKVTNKTKETKKNKNKGKD
jgi:hypothetical protein